MLVLSRLQLRLLSEAAAARERAHSPYSRFAVGACLVWGDLPGPSGLQQGCNVENASFGLSICAERAAVFAAVMSGMEPGSLKAIAIVGGEEDGPAITPCGACRQVLAEFSRPASEKGGMEIICAPRWSNHDEGSEEEEAELSAIRIYALADLLPHAFSL